MRHSKLISNWLFLVVIFGLGTVSFKSLLHAAEPSAIAVNRVFTGRDGLSHIEQIQAKLSSSSAIPGMLESELFDQAGMRLVRRPPSLAQDWHPTGQPQYAVTISGRGEIEAANGQKLVLDPGSVLLVEDVGSKGHKTRTLGTKDWTLMVVNLPKK